MTMLTMTKGLPASGKSTWAADMAKARRDTSVICKDDLRPMLHPGQKWSGRREKAVVAARDALIAGLLPTRNVIVADTNLAPKHETRLRQLAKEHGAEFRVQSFLDVPLHVCLKRDLERGNRGERSAGELTIRQMHEQFVRPLMTKAPQFPEKPPAIICDLDGTLANISWRNPYDATECERDEPNTQVLAMLLDALDMEKRVFILSGRSDLYEKQTRRWLRSVGLAPGLDRGLLTLHMREDGDIRRDAELKDELFFKHVAHDFNVRYVLDDRQQVVDYWRDLGLTVFQVADGNF